MPLQNRVTPLGDLIVTPYRGLVYGNRGCLHNERGDIRRRYSTKRWIACRLCFRGRRRSPLMEPGRFTELFFLDEATALAAGHRPCAECRRSDYNRFSEAWSRHHPGQTGAEVIDAQLHAERLSPSGRDRLLHDAPYDELPDGAFVLEDDRPHLVLGPRVLPWSPGGYGGHRRRPTNRRAALITPPSIVAVLNGGWEPDVPFLHPSAGA